MIPKLSESKIGAIAKVARCAVPHLSGFLLAFLISNALLFPLASARAGGLYVADSSGNRVVRFKTPLKHGEKLSLVLGQPNFTSGGGNLTANGMNEPWHVIFQSSTNILWVSDSANERVLGFKAPFSDGQDADIVLGEPNTTSDLCGDSSNDTCFPTDVAFDGAGNLWVADTDNSRVLKFEPPFSTGQSASLVIGQPGFGSHTCVHTTPDGLCDPWALSFDHSGNLWVLDADNNRVVEYEAPFSTGESASLVLGEPDLTHSVCAVTRTGLCTGEFAGDMRIDKKGNVWVSDNFNNRVLEFARGTGFTDGQMAAVVIGQPDFTSHASATTKNGLNIPGSITFDGTGNLYVAEEGNCRVLEFKPKNGKFKTNQKASLVLGQPNFTSMTCAVTQTNLQNPNGIAFGP